MTAQRRLRSFAKINLDLRVLYKRTDGFHELRTIFQTISLEDRITVRYERSPETSITVDGNIAIEHNLIARAAHLVLEEAKTTGIFRFHMQKRIPMGAGLGGGSSNAAAILLALPRLLGVVVPMARLHELAASLGSDVPFFLHGGTAVGLGRGEELYPLPDLPPFHGLLATPDIHVSTPDAYRALSPRLEQSPADHKRAAFAEFAWSENLSLARNDFEEVVFAMHPAIAAIRDALERSGALCARMSGSGSSVFGLFASRAAAVDAQSALPLVPAIPFSLISRKRYAIAHPRS